MSNQFLKLRRSAVPGKIPDTGSLALGEIALNTYDGLAFMKKSGSNGEEVVVIGNSSGSFSGSFSGEFTGSLLGTASWAYNALTASTADNFFVRGNITGSNALFTGTVTAQTLVVQTITSSVLYSSGSNVFGNKLTDTQQFTGSVTITGSLTSANVNLTGSFSGSISNLDGATNFIAKFDSPNSVDSSVIYQSASHIAINETNFTVDNPEALYVFQTHPTSINVLTGKGNLNNYLQNNIQNTNQGVSASSDVVATANNGNENSNYVDMGINSENYNQNFIGGPNDAYLYSIANNLHIGNANDNGTHVALFVGGVDVDANTKIQLNANNRHVMSGSLALTGSLSVKEGITGSLFGTSSWAVSASRALSGNGGFSGSFTGSFFGNGAGLTNISASSVVGLNLSLIGSGSVTASTDPAYGFRVNSNTQISGSTQITGSLGLTGSFSVSGSLGSLFSANVDTMVFTGSLFQSGSIQLTGSLNVTRGGITGSLFGTSSWAISASHAPTSLTASFAVSSSLAQTASLAILAPAYTTTASFTQFTSSYYADSSSFSGSISLLSQSFLQTSSSYASASGSLSTRTTNLELTASVLTTASASFTIVSSSYAALSGSFRSGSYTGSFTGVGNLTGSLFGTSSWSSNAVTSSNSLTASFVLQAVSASFATSASFSTTASFAASANVFPFTGSAIISGSLDVTGSVGFAYNSLQPIGPGVWSSGGSLSSVRLNSGGAGTQNEALVFGGATTSYTLTNITEEYNGTAWSAGGAMITTRCALGGTGTQNAALGFGGLSAPSYTRVACTEAYNGSTWSAGSAMITARGTLAGAGIQNAALAIGGYAPSDTTCTEEYNGTSWSSGGALINALYARAGAGIQNAAIVFGGYCSPTQLSCTELYDGTSWSAGGALSAARYGLAGAGTQASALAFGGAVRTPAYATVACTEVYNGSTWSAGVALITDRCAPAGAGTQTSALAIGGYRRTGDVILSSVEEYSPSLVAAAIKTFDYSSTTGNIFATGSLLGTATSASFAISATSASFATSASLSVSASFVTTASFASSASFSTTASFATTASFVLNAVSASFAATASSADNFLIRQNATASNLLVNNTITAQTLVVQTITSSVDFVTGSTKFGTQLTNTHQFTGSVTITGSLSLNDSPVVTNTTFTPFSSSVSTRLVTLENASSSFASVSSSYSQASQSLSTRTTNLESTASILTTASASFALVSSSYSAFSQSYNTGSFTGSFTGNLTGTSSFSISSSLAANSILLNGTGSSVFATTGSNIFVGNQIVTGSLFTSGSNTLVGSTTLTGSLSITGSTVQTGNNTLLGNTSLSGSIIISGTLGSTPSVKIYGDTQHNGYIRFDPVTTNIDTSISASYIFVSGSTQDLYFSQNGKGYSNVTRLRWLEGNLYTGLLNGGLITSQSSTTYQVGSGSGIIVNLNASLNDNPYPTTTYFNWPNLTGNINQFSASYDQTFVAISSTGTLISQSTAFLNGQVDTQIPVGYVAHQDNSTINGTVTEPSLAYGWKQRSNVFISAFGPLKLSGFNLAVSGSSTGSLIVGSGTAFLDGGNYQTDPNNPSYVTATGTSTSRIFRYYESGSDWVYNTNGGVGFGAIDPARYSNNGTLSSVGAGNWSIQRVFFFPTSPLSPKPIVVYYGNEIYATEADAIANIPIEPFTEAPSTAAAAIYLGAIVISGNGVFTNTSTFTIYPGGLFRQVGGSGGGGSLVTQTLAGLSDVLISGPTNGQPLVYNNISGKWQNSSTLTATLTGNADTATSASHALTSSYAISSSQAATASYVLQAVSSSFATSASFVQNAQTASYVLQAVSASFATSASLAQTASSADNFLVRQNITASNGLITGTLTAQTLIVQTVTSSVVYSSGSNVFGNNLNNTQQFTGSVTITGSLSLNDSSVVTNATFTPFSSSISTRLVTLENASSSFASVSSSYSQASQSLSTRTTNLESTASVLTTASASFAIVSSSYASASGSLSTRVTTLENASASFAQQSGSNSIRLTNLESTASVLTTASASFAIVSASYSALSGSFRSGSYTGSFTGTLIGTASWASNAVTSSYILNAVSASFASTASSVNTLNQDVIITSSLTVGANTQGPSENTLTLGPRGASEGGQLGLQAPGGTYTSASMLDNYQDRFRILRGSNAGSDAEIASFNMHTKQFFLPSYNNVSSYPGTAVAYLGVNSSGDVITVSAGTVSSASFASTASLAFTALTASFVTSSNVFGPFGSNSILTSSFATSASFVLNAVSASFVTTASFALTANTASYVLNAISASYVFEAVSASFASTASFATSASFTTTSSFAVSSSNASTASFVLNAISASFAATASSADNFVIRQDATASNLLVNNTITAQTLVVQTVTSSIVYSSGSNIFGNNLNNTQQFTGSVTVTGSLTLNDSPVVTNTTFTPFSSSVSTRLVTLENASSSFALVSSSYSAFSQSYNTGSFTGSFTGVLIGTASWAQNALTSSYVINAISASYSSTSSFVNTLYQDVVITGSFNTTGSVFLTGLTTSSQANVVGYDVATGQLYFQTAAGGSSVTASYALTASAATEFTVRNTLTIGSAMSDYSTVASSVVGSNNLFTQAVGSYTSAFFKYTVTNGANARSGEVMSVWNGTTTQFTDNSTLDVGSTTPVTCSVSIVGSDVQFNVQTNTSGWAIKALATFM